MKESLVLRKELCKFKLSNPAKFINKAKGFAKNKL